MSWLLLGFWVVCLGWMVFDLVGKGCGKIEKMIVGLGLHMSLIGCVFGGQVDNGSHGNVCRSFCILGR